MTMIPSSQAAATPQVNHTPQLREVAQQFEAIFLRDMIGAMRQAGLNDDLLGNSGGDQFRDMMDDRIADDMAQTKGIGIADMLVAQWSRDGTNGP